jgi:hypothetical protein
MFQPCWNADQREHFGIASMYQARARRPLALPEKRALQVGFVAVALHLILLINMRRGLGTENMFGVVGTSTSGLLLPSSAYPISAAAAGVGVSAYVLAETWHARRTTRGLAWSVRLLFLTNFLWFVSPFVHLPGRDVRGDALDVEEAAATFGVAPVEG